MRHAFAGGSGARARGPDSLRGAIRPPCPSVFPSPALQRSLRSCPRHSKPCREGRASAGLPYRRVQPVSVSWCVRRRSNVGCALLNRASPCASEYPGRQHSLACTSLPRTGSRVRVPRWTRLGRLAASPLAVHDLPRIAVRWAWGLGPAEGGHAGHVLRLGHVLIAGSACGHFSAHPTGVQCGVNSWQLARSAGNLSASRGEQSRAEAQRPGPGRRVTSSLAASRIPHHAWITSLRGQVIYTRGVDRGQISCQRECQRDRRPVRRCALRTRGQLRACGAVACAAGMLVTRSAAGGR